MIFQDTNLNGVSIIDVEELHDERGFFGRSFCREEFEAHDLDPNVSQCNISYNERRGTLRGMHFQRPPFEEAKLVRCTRGAIYDVIIDIRPESPTYRQTLGVELTADNRRMVFVPKGLAHGFQALSDGAEVFYQMSAPYRAEAGCGIRWNDSAFAIDWPITDPILSARDSSYPDWRE